MKASTVLLSTSAWEGLPVVAIEAAAREPTGPHDEAEFSTPKRRVLVVDDDETIRMMSQRMIEMLGHTVRTASDGEEAVAVVEEFRPEIVLMDIELLGINGIQGTKVIKDKNPHIDIVMVTVYEDSELVFEALKAGASGYITKSANYLELLTALEEIMKSKKIITAYCEKI